MKTKLLFQTSAAILLLFVSLPASSQPAPAGMGGMPITIDPTTGLPVVQQWIAPSWKDPDVVLTNVSYDGLPLSEVARNLRERFGKYFDVLPMPHTFDKDWGSEIVVQLQLKDVKASDIFNAMNLVFENDRTPVRWELKMNGSRPIVLLHVMSEAAPNMSPSPKPAETHRMVIFIGNLLGDEKSGGMTMDHIIKTIDEVWPADFGKLEGIIQFHSDAQLLVINGTHDQIDFIQQTLAALRQKVNAARGPMFGGGGRSPPREITPPRIEPNTNNVGDQ